MTPGSQLRIWRLLSAVAILTAACALHKGPQPVTNSLPPERLAYFCDSFESIRPDVWEKAGFVFTTAQLRNFIAGETVSENGKLRMDTKTGGFSKAGLVSQFTLKGDFDLQLNCKITFLDGDFSMDQVLAVGVMEKGKTLRQNRGHFIGIAKDGKSRNRLIYSGYLEQGKYHSGSRSSIGDFDGTVRFIRVGDKIISYYKNSDKKNWVRMSSQASVQDSVTVGFVLQNFFRKRSSINATRSITAWCDDFVINSAEEIVEGDI